MDRQLPSVSGVGEVTSWTGPAFLAEIPQREPNAVLALAGEAPFLAKWGHRKATLD